MQNFQADNAQFFYQSTGKALPDGNDAQKNGGREKPLIVWAHGWGQNHSSFIPLITPLESLADHITLDQPGFGQSPPPHENWGTKDYADLFAKWITENNLAPVIWVGHSFGCRVGVQLAAHYPELVSQLILVAGAGLKRKRPLHKKVYFYCRIRLFKFLRRFVPDGTFKDKLMTRFGSADYKSAGPMRKIFVRVVNEDLSETATKITCPTTLIYGTNDTETPPEFGERYSQLINDSKLFLLDGQDHYSVLQNGRHQVVKIISDILRKP